MKNEHDANLILAENLAQSWMTPSRQKHHYTPTKQGPGVITSGVLIGLILAAPFLVQIIIDIIKG